MLTGIVKIGEKEYRMSCAASVNINYYNIFHEDFLSMMNPEEPTKAITPFIQMAFVMAKQAELGFAETSKLTKNDFAAWMEEFTVADLFAAVGDIQALYLSSTSGTVNSKKNTEEQTDR